MLQLGNGPRTHDENRAHFTMWAMLAAPLMLGTIVSNDEVIAIDQDPLGRQARRVRNEDDMEVWARPLEDGAVAVAFLNRGESEAGGRRDLRVPQIQQLLVVCQGLKALDNFDAVPSAAEALTCGLLSQNSRCMPIGRRG